MVGEMGFERSRVGRRIRELPLAHLSIELGHFYGDDLSNEYDFFRDHFRRLAPWVAVARASCSDVLAGKRTRISTCFLVDDHFSRPGSPTVIIPKLIDAARESDLSIDYIARESGLASPPPAEDGDDLEAEAASLAELVEARMVEDPPPGTTGARPPASQTGWLCNGQRSPTAVKYEAMKKPGPWVPPKQNVANSHSIFVDVELWNSVNGARRWSCAMLASVWQLLRLGVLRDNGRPVVPPQPLPEDLPDDWKWMPPIAWTPRTGGRPAPFSAYRTLSICHPRFLQIEHAVRVILEQVAIDPIVLGQIERRSSVEGVALPSSIVDRIEYAFVDTGTSAPC